MPQNIRTAQFENITHPTVYAAKLLSSTIHGAIINRGKLYEDKLAQIAIESRRFADVRKQVRVSLQSSDGDRLYEGTRKSHRIDIVCTDAESVQLYNVKSRGISQTNDHTLTIRTMVAARKRMQELHPELNVSYQLLKIGGESIPEWDDVGITTLDADEWASSLLEAPYALERDVQLQLKIIHRIKDGLHRHCQELGLPDECVDELMNMLHAAGDNLSQYAAHLQILRR